MIFSKPHSFKKVDLFTSIFISLLAILFLMTSVSISQAAGKAYVTNIYGTTISIVDLSTNNIIEIIDIYTPSSSCTSETPYIHDIESIGPKVFVSVPGASSTQCEINQIAVIDTVTDTIVNTIDTDRAPTGLTEYNGKLYVLNQASNTIQEIDPNTETILRTIPFPNLSSFQINNPSSLEIVDGKIYLPYPGSENTAGGVGIIDLASGNLIIFKDFKNIHGEDIDRRGPLGIKQVADHKIYLGGVRDVAVFDTTNDKIVNVVRVKNETEGLIACFTVASNKVYTANQESSVSVLNLSTDTFINQIDLAIHPSEAHPIVDIVAFNDKVYATDAVNADNVPQGVHIIDSTTDTVVGKISTERLFGAIDILEAYVPFPKGLVAHWKFTQDHLINNGTEFVDLSGMGNNATIVNPDSEALYFSDPEKEALRFNGYSNTELSGHIYLDLSTDLSDPERFGKYGDNNQGALTITAIVKVDDAGAWDMICSGCGPFYYMSFGAGGSNNYLISMVSTVCISDPNNGLTTKWTHIAFILEEGKGFQYYINGEPDEYNPNIDISFRRIDNAHIGNYFHQGNNFFNGSINEIKLWNRALTAEEILLELPVPPSKKAYISNLMGSNVSVVNLNTNQVIKTIDIHTPSSFCSSVLPHINDIKVLGSKVFLTVPGADESQLCEINQIKVIDSATDTIVNTIETNRVPSGLKEYNGKLYVVHRNTSTVLEIDPSTEAILRSIPYTNPTDMNNPMYLEIVNGEIYLAFPGSGVQVLDLANGNQSAFIDFGSVDNYGPWGIKKVANNKIYLGGRFDVAVLDTTTDTINKTIRVKDEGAGFVLNFAVASNKVYTANSESTVSVINLSNDTFITQIDVGVHPFAAHPVDIVGTGNRVYVTDPLDINGDPQGVKIIDSKTDTWVDNIPTEEFFGAIDLFSITPIENSPPEGLSVQVAPDPNAYVNDDLLCTASGVTDKDGDVISYRYEWKKGGVTEVTRDFIECKTSDTLEAFNTNQNETWSCVVTAKDTSGAEISATSNQVFIYNRVPVITTSPSAEPHVWNEGRHYEIQINPEDPDGNEFTLEIDTNYIDPNDLDWIDFDTNATPPILIADPPAGSSSLDVDYGPGIFKFNFIVVETDGIPIRRSEKLITAEVRIPAEIVDNFEYSENAPTLGDNSWYKLQGYGQMHLKQEDPNDPNSNHYLKTTTPSNNSQLDFIIYKVIPDQTFDNLYPEIHFSISDKNLFYIDFHVKAIKAGNEDTFFLRYIPQDPNDAGWETEVSGKYVSINIGTDSIDPNGIEKTEIIRNMDADLFNATGFHYLYLTRIFLIGDIDYLDDIIVWSRGVSVEMNLLKGWSMISLPLLPDNGSVSSLFPDAVVVYGYKKGKGYVRVNEGNNLETGRGYWILLDEAKTFSISGEIIDEYNFSVQDGWYMIGGCTSDAKASVDNGSISVIYGYEQGSGYKSIQEGENLKSGRGYWIQFKDVVDQCELTVEATDPNIS